ncbi:MAG TPA: hypothetical protein VHI71_11500 [Actinomycetota bacterium]|nr:hypothetical protein [Actinomycetota bacterium]
MTIDKEQAERKLRAHFEGLSASEFSDRVEAQSGGDAPMERPSDDVGQLVLLQHPQASPLPLNAYFASSLTTLSDEERATVERISEIVDAACTRHGIELYRPGSHSDPIKHPDISASDVYFTDRDRVVKSDLVIHLADFPSTGAGEELDMAQNALIPILLLRHSSRRMSRMVAGIPAFKAEISYQDEEDLSDELGERLVEMRPVLEERKVAFAQYDVNLVGAKIRALREDIGLTRSEVSDKAPVLDEDRLRHIEESVDKAGNPTLMELRQLAVILKTTVADLVEPDLGARLLATLQEWIVGAPSAARFGSITVADRNRILRRLLYRVIDSLDRDV